MARPRRILSAQLHRDRSERLPGQRPETDRRRAMKFHRGAGLRRRFSFLPIPSPSRKCLVSAVARLRRAIQTRRYPLPVALTTSRTHTKIRKAAFSYTCSYTYTAVSRVSLVHTKPYSCTYWTQKPFSESNERRKSPANTSVFLVDVSAFMAYTRLTQKRRFLGRVRASRSG